MGLRTDLRESVATATAGVDELVSDARKAVTALLALAGAAVIVAAVALLVAARR